MAAVRGEVCMGEAEAVWSTLARCLGDPACLNGKWGCEGGTSYSQGWVAHSFERVSIKDGVGATSGSACL